MKRCDVEEEWWRLELGISTKESGRMLETKGNGAWWPRVELTLL
jgi:hypothetical protein